MYVRISSDGASLALSSTDNDNVFTLFLLNGVIKQFSGGSDRP